MWNTALPGICRSRSCGPIRGEIAPAVLDERGFKRAVGDSEASKARSGAEALLGLRGEIVEGLDAGVRVLGEVAEIERGRLARRIAEDDDRALRLDARDRRGSEAPPAAFEDQREAALRLVDAGRRSRRRRARRERRPRSGLPTTAVTRAPDRAASCTARLPDPAGGAGDQHPLAEQRRAVAQGAQRRQAGDRQGRGILERDIVRQAPPCGGPARRRAAPSRHCRSARRPACRPAGRCRRPRPRSTTPADVLAGPPAFGPDLEQPQFAAVQRKGLHLDQRLVRPPAAAPATSRIATGAAPFGVLTRASMLRASTCRLAPHPPPQAGEGMLRPAARPRMGEGLPVATSVQPQIGDVLRVGLQFAASRPG